MHTRLIRISNSVGDVFYTPVGPGGQFALRVPADFRYAVVAGPLLSIPVGVNVSAGARVHLEAFRADRAEAPPDPSTIDWMRKQAAPLAVQTPGVQEPDHRAFASIAGAARVVGLGENSHGVGDFAEARNQFFEAAVTRLGFDVFAIEANFTEALAINDYVLTGRGIPPRSSQVSTSGYLTRKRPAP